MDVRTETMTLKKLCFAFFVEELKNIENRFAWFLIELCNAETGVQKDKRNQRRTELVRGLFNVLPLVVMRNAVAQYKYKLIMEGFTHTE